MTHVFDVDHTVLAGSSMGYFVREALGEGILRPWQLRWLPLEWLRYCLGRPDPDFIEKAVALMAGIDRERLELAAERCFEPRMRRDVYPGAAALIRGALERGERVIFASASFRPVLRPLERFLGVSGSIACEPEYGADGRTTGRLVGASPFGQKKKAAVEAWLAENGIEAADVSFYSDSYVDIPLLEHCGRPVAVNPDRTLARKARECGWEIMRFAKGEER